jgi:hypothetical protein
VNKLLKFVLPLWLPLLVATAGVCVMSWFLMVSLLQGDFRAEGRILIDMPWGVLSLLDLYTGLLLFSCWIWWREHYMSTAMLWTLALLLAGNLGSCLYVLVAIWQSKGKLDRFIYGHRLSYTLAAGTQWHNAIANAPFRRSSARTTPKLESIGHNMETRPKR